MEGTLNDIKEIQYIIKEQRKCRGLLKNFTRKQKVTKQERLNRRMYMELWPYKHRCN
jgi:hypothetical protein